MSEKNPEVNATQDSKAKEWLVVRCQLGEVAAFEELVERWHPHIWRYVLSVTGAPQVAEDILQESWLRILRGISGLREATHLRAWLFTIVRRTVLDRLRGRYAEPTWEELDEEAEDPEALEPAFAENAEILLRALSVLSQPDRDTLSLFYLQELDLGEVSEILEVPIGTVKSRLHRARRQLREELKRQGVQP